MKPNGVGMDRIKNVISRKYLGKSPTVKVP